MIVDKVLLPIKSANPVEF
jgi:hypothetical protein